MFAQPKIAIIGAGPAGLTLANILRNHQIPFTVYESDKSPHERNQGGSLDLHPRTGQLALQEAGLWEDFTRRARPESDVMKLVDQITGEALWDGNGKDARVVEKGKEFDNRPEIDREALRDLLVHPLLEADCIQWGARLELVKRGQDDKVDLHLKDGTIEKDFDLVVGADGAWSKVRNLITDVKPFYSGITLVELWATQADTRNPFISSYAGRGSCFSFAEGRAIQMQRQGDGTIRTYASVRKPETFLQDCGIDWTNPATAREEYINTYFGDCTDDLKRVMLESTDEFIPRKLYMLPTGNRWETTPGVTLLGDAAHLMTPFAGVGVNAAMADALELSRELIAYCTTKSKESGLSNMTQVIKKYEEAMFPRGEAFARKTDRGLVGHFSEGGNQHMLARLKEAYGGA